MVDLDANADFLKTKFLPQEDEVEYDVEYYTLCETEAFLENV